MKAAAFILLLFLSAFSVLFASIPQTQALQTQTIYVTQSSDDCTRSVPLDTFGTDNTTLRFEFGTVEYQNGLFFEGVTMDSFDELVTAKLAFYTSSVGSGTIDIDIYGAVDETPLTFSTKEDFDARTLTTYYEVGWSPTALTGYKEVDVSSEAFEMQMASLTDWVFILKTTAGSGYRNFKSFDYPTGIQYPRLIITWREAIWVTFLTNKPSKLMTAYMPIPLLWNNTSQMGWEDYEYMFGVMFNGNYVFEALNIYGVNYTINPSGLVLMGSSNTTVYAYLNDYTVAPSGFYDGFLLGGLLCGLIAFVAILIIDRR